MKKTFLPFFILTTCLFLQSFSYTYRGTTSLGDWLPERGANGPEIKSLTLKWEMNDNGEKPEGSFYMQWYLGDFYAFENEKIDLRDLGEDMKLLSITTLVLEATVFSEVDSIKNYGTIELDMGVTPPHGGTWGNEISRTLDWDEVFIQSESDGKPVFYSEERTRLAFESGFELGELKIKEIVFGGIYNVESRISEIRKDALFTSSMKDGDRAYEFKEYANAINFYKEAGKMNPGSQEIKDKIKQSEYMIEMVAGNQAVEAGDHEGAIRHFREAGRILPSKSEPGEEIAKAERLVGLNDEYAKLVTELNARYKLELTKSEEEQAKSLQAASASISGEGEACNLEYMQFYACNEAYLNKKIENIPNEAKHLVYGDPIAKVKAETSNMCIKPACNRYAGIADSVSPGSNVLLTAAKRKYKVYKEKGYQSFFVHSKSLLDQALIKDPTSAEAYLFRAQFAQDLITKLNDVELALKYNPNLVEAQEIKRGIAAPFKDELYENIRKGNTEYILRALDKNLIDKTEPHKDYTPVQYALVHDQPGAIELLMGATPKSLPSTLVENEAQTLLFLASEKDKAASARFLLTRGASPTVANDAGNSPLEVATQSGSNAVIKVFLKERPDIDLTPSLILATQSNKINLTRTFLEGGANINATDNRGDNLLMMSIKLRHMEMIDALINSGADVNHTNKDNLTPLAYAAQQRMPKVIAKLLAKEARAFQPMETLSKMDPENATYLTVRVMQYAVDKDSKPHAKQSIQFNDKIALATSDRNQPFILHALDDGKVKLAATLLESKVDYNQPIDGKNLLLTALEKEALMVVEVLVREKKADLQVKNENQETALHLAILKGNMGIVDLLLNRDHPLDEKDHKGQTPLHVALREKNNEMADRLIMVGADLQVADQKNWQPIHISTYLGDLQRVKLFAGRDIDLNATGESGMTPLHYAAQKGNIEIIRFLIDNGADKEKKDYFKRTPHKVAKEVGNKHVLKSLK